MHVLFPLLGFLSASYAITTSPPDPNMPNDLYTGLTTVTSITKSALLMKNKPSSDPEIDRRRLGGRRHQCQIYIGYQTRHRFFAVVWLEDPSPIWTTKEVLVHWKVVLQEYRECPHSVSEAGRYIQGRLQLLGQS